jgi:hypothetical protein
MIPNSSQMLGANPMILKSRSHHAVRWIGLSLPSIAFFAILLSSRVLAQDCLLLGRLINCDDGTSGQRIGNTTYWNDGTSSQRIGRSTYNSDGTSSQTIGNSTYYSDGTSSQRIGNTTYFSDGRSCQHIGRQIICN